MVFLVVRHSATATFEFVEPLSQNWWVCNIYGSLSAWMIPVFLMISGAVFLDPARNVTIDRLYKRNIFRIFTAFVFWALFYAVYNTVMQQGETTDFLTMLFQGHFHLWFLPMIIGLYVLTPLLRTVSNNHQALTAVTFVTLIFGVCLPSLQDLELFFDESVFTGANNFGYVCAYVAFFYAGYYLHKTEVPKRVRVCLYAAGIACFAIVFYGTYRLTLLDGVHNEDMQADNNIFSFVEGVAIFLACKYGTKSRVPKESTQAFILESSALTFGVYMVHVVLLAFLDRMGFSPVAYPAVYIIPLLIAFVLPASFFLSFAFRKIPIVGKYIT
jgi:surface polysaccharide O-acyltransferase-like enzyme